MYILQYYKITTIKYYCFRINKVARMYVNAVNCQVFDFYMYIGCLYLRYLLKCRGQPFMR